MLDVKGFVTSRPPLVVFIICLGGFAVTLMSFAYYVKVTKLQSPDTSKDWNVFLRNFSHLEFCILSHNQSELTPPNTMTTKIPLTTPESEPLDDDVRSFSVSMLVDVTPTREFMKIPHNITFLTGTIYGEQLGLQGSAGDEQINVTMQLPVEWNQRHCKKSEQCKTVQIFSCVYFQASQRVFPTSQKPKVCEPMNDTGIEYHARMRGDLFNREDLYQPVVCKSQPSIKLHYELDPTLTVYLSLSDRSVINLHLMHTSYFLFVMVITLLVYAVIKGHKSKISHADKAELLKHTDA